jgi:hypothetical protein
MAVDQDITTREIPLTNKKGQVLGIAIVDAEDYELVSQVRWYLIKGYAHRSVKTEGKFIGLKMHREIIDAPKGVQVDHINGNKLDNRKINLRLCNNSQNQVNRGKAAVGSSTFKGVYLFKGAWVARVTFNRKGVYLGRFGSEADAARAYDRKAQELFGDFAQLNFPPH